MGVDVDQPGLDFGDPVRIARGVGFAQQRVALEVGLQHDLDQAFRPVRGFLRETADAPARRDRDGSAFGRQLAADHPEQRRFADAVAADEADPRARHDLRRAVIDQEPSGKPDRDVGDGKHARVVTAAAAKRNRFVREKSPTAVAEQVAQPSWAIPGGSRCPGCAARPRDAGVGGRVELLRAQALLQPLAHGIADRSAGLAVDWFAVVYDSAVHGGFRCNSMSDLMPNQVAAAKMVSRQGRIAWPSS